MTRAGDNAARSNEEVAQMTRADDNAARSNEEEWRK
ncbi:MAG: hypothetical protein QOG14_4852 [Mycobacterium sp.]|jgi:hypothetical protein|nr:hypothetical protein [Mycobacterium sp.]